MKNRSLSKYGLNNMKHFYRLDKKIEEQKKAHYCKNNNFSAKLKIIGM